MATLSNSLIRISDLPDGVPSDLGASVKLRATKNANIAAVCGPVKSGFTLMEVLLVLAILAVVAAFAAPSFESMISGRRLKNMVDRLALELGDARLEAIRTGQAQVFTAVIGGADYTTKPWLDGYDEVNASSGATIQETATGQTIQTESAGGTTIANNVGAAGQQGEVKSLDKGVQFYAIDTLVDSRNAAAIESQTGGAPGTGASAANSSGESSPILFYPDGTATTGKIQLIDDRGRRMIIEIRGVTGRINVYRAIGVDSSVFVQSMIGLGGGR